MDQVNWGIIGCGDVTEVKSGPAFQLVEHSRLVAVMRRNPELAQDYARRHHVDKWYGNARELIADPAVNAIYIATPPSSHVDLTLQALQQGKPVYVEKPVSLDAAGAREMARMSEKTGMPLVAAHYRRAQPLFIRVAELIRDQSIGAVRSVNITFNKQRLTAAELDVPKTAWRLDASVSGGGLFHDLAPHQLDIIYHLFGEAVEVQGLAFNQAGAYAADDLVTAIIHLQNNILFTGTWCFSAAAADNIDRCEIIGDQGSLTFSFFEQAPLILRVRGTEQRFIFEPLKHVQQPMIATVVKYFRGEAQNPCPVQEAAVTMDWIDRITLKKNQ